jgi:polysaccharide biosynthesis/export protein PslD
MASMASKRLPKAKHLGVMGLIGLMAFMLLMGCQGLQPSVRQPDVQVDPTPRLLLRPGDSVEIKFYYSPELNSLQTVRSDGKITLELVGDVAVDGKLPEEVRDILKNLYRSELKHPEVTVIVRSQYGRRVYVGGEVKRPGLIEMPGSLTALAAIIQAGGFDPKTAQVKNVVLIRHKDGKRYGAALNLEDTLQGKDGQAFYLEPGDIVYVPRTTIAQVNQWIDQYINKVIPRTGLNLLYPVGSGVIGVDTATTVYVP